MSELVRSLRMQVENARLPEPQQEFHFAPPRLWRFDLAWPELMLAVECDGGVYTQGRHTRGRGFENDMRKLNTAAILGWSVLRFSTSLIRSGEALRYVEMAIRQKVSA